MLDDCRFFFDFCAFWRGVRHVEGCAGCGLPGRVIEIAIATRKLQVDALAGATVLDLVAVVCVLGLLHQIYGRFLHGFLVVEVLGVRHFELVAAFYHALEQSIINLMAPMVRYREPGRRRR